MTTNYNKVNSFTSNKSEKITSAPSEQASSRMHDYRMHLRAITDGLVEMAKATGRKKFSCNQLLRECYNMVDAEFHTYDEWKEQGAFVRRGEHAYLFWGAPVTNERGVRYCPVEFRFSREQVRFKEVNAL
jgi:hypothetical protein